MSVMDPDHRLAAAGPSLHMVAGAGVRRRADPINRSVQIGS